MLRSKPSSRAKVKSRTARQNRQNRAATSDRVASSSILANTSLGQTLHKSHSPVFLSSHHVSKRVVAQTQGSRRHSQGNVAQRTNYMSTLSAPTDYEISNDIIGVHARARPEAALIERSHFSRNLTDSDVTMTVHMSPQSQSSSSSSTLRHPLAPKTSPPTSSPHTVSTRSFAMRALSRDEKRRLRKQKAGNHVYIPSYVHAKDLSQRLHITMMQLHKAGTSFFNWWPRSSERQLKRDGYSMLNDLVLRFDESSVLCKFLGYHAIYEHTGLERIRNEHYALQGFLQEMKEKGVKVTPGMRRDYLSRKIGRGTGPKPTPEELRPKRIQPKQPVVTIVGHVNHGKTTLLDYLRGTHLAKREDGGITQELYSYQCDLGNDLVQDWNNDPSYNEQSIPLLPPDPNNDTLDRFTQDTLLKTYQKVTFLDTPGHASFFDMRENGVVFSDLVVLVVSAQEGVCPQTLESIEYIKTFNVPVVVALTKCDLPDSNPQRVMKQLQEAGLNPRTYTEDGALDSLITPAAPKQSKIKRKAPTRISPCVPISALKGENMTDFRRTLMKIFMTVKPQCDIAAPPVGLVLEAFTEEGGRGKVMRILLSSGLVETGDAFVSGLFSGHVKDLRIFGDIHTPDFTELPKHLAFPNDNSEKPLNVKEHLLDVAKQKVLANREKTFATSTRKPKLGQQVNYAIPGIPLEVIGIDGIPSSGDDMRVVPDRLLAKTIAETRRLEMEYPDQGRFKLGGLKPSEWDHPPLVFIDEYRKNPRIFDKYVNTDLVLNPEIGDSGGVIHDIDTDNEQGSDEDNQHSMQRVNRQSKQVRFDEFQDDDSEFSDFYSSAYQPAESTLDHRRLQLSDSDDDYDDSSSGDDTATSTNALVHQGIDRQSLLPQWDRVHEIEFEYQRPFVLKSGTAGGIKMILDSVDAFNERYPNKKIHVVHAGMGSLTEADLLKASGAVDPDLDPDMECPVLLYRTRSPQLKAMQKAKLAKIPVYEYTVFDDLLKHMIGNHYYNEMFHDSHHLRKYAPGTLFAETPRDNVDSVTTSSADTETMTTSGEPQNSIMDRSKQQTGQNRPIRRDRSPRRQTTGSLGISMNAQISLDGDTTIKTSRESRTHITTKDITNTVLEQTIETLVEQTTTTYTPITTIATDDTTHDDSSKSPVPQHGQNNVVESNQQVYVYKSSVKLTDLVQEPKQGSSKLIPSLLSSQTTTSKPRPIPVSTSSTSSASTSHILDESDIDKPAFGSIKRTPLNAIPETRLSSIDLSREQRGRSKPSTVQKGKLLFGRVHLSESRLGLDRLKTQEEQDDKM